MKKKEKKKSTAVTNTKGQSNLYPARKFVNFFLSVKGKKKVLELFWKLFWKLFILEIFFVMPLKPLLCTVVAMTK